MRTTTGLLACSLLLSLSGADKPKVPAIASTSNNIVEVTARAITDLQEVTDELGIQPQHPMILIDIKVRPREDGKIRIDRDDFILVSAKDGQRSQPLEPSQIAGKGALVVTQTGRGGASVEQGRGPVWGGIGGRPQTMGGSGVGLGTGSSATAVEGKVDAKAPESPLLAVLKAKIMPNAPETEEQVSGLLYFLFDGKPPKPKDLTLIYKGAGGGRLLLEFTPPKK